MKIALIQIASSNDKAKNLEKISKSIREAVANSAELIALPEVFNYRAELGDAITNYENIEDSESLKLLEALAKELEVWVLSGSILAHENSSSMPLNTSVLINPQGKITAKYSKIHLFKVSFGDKVIDESQKSQAGTKPVIAEIISEEKSKFKIGMSICYDLRFPELYRNYAKKHCEIIYVPSAFTYKTGEAHWEILLRARAIENQAYVIAPNQCGSSSGVESYGNSMVIDPWGNILARASTKDEEIIYTKIDLETINKARSIIPALEHIRLI